jgi:translocation and assembly module TamB
MAQDEDITREGPPEPGEETVVVERPTLLQRAKIRALKTVTLLVLGTVGLAVAVIFGIDTGPGHRFVADQIAALEFQNGMKIEVGRIEGSLYGSMTLHDLSVRDPKGEFLFSPEVHVDWRPLEYFGNHVNVRSASAERLFLRRAPQFRETPPSNAPLLPDLGIDIGKLRIDRFYAEPPVSGELRIMRFAGKVHIADRRAQIQAQGTTIAIKGKEGGDRFDLLLDAEPSRNRLAIDLDLKAPTGGVIASLGGLKQALAVKVSGKGDWTAWNGRLDARFGEGELARLGLTARDGTFAIKGPTRIARMFDGPVAGLLGPVTNIDVTAALADRRARVTGMISSDAFDLTPSGLVDLSDNSFEKLQLAFVLNKPTALAENLSGADLRAILTLDGAFATPKVAYNISARRIAVNDMGMEGFTANGAARVDAGRIMIPVAARVQRITGLDTVAGGTLANVHLDGDLAIEGPRILSDNLRLKSDRIDAGVTLVADMSKGFYTGLLDGRLDNYRLASVGIFNINTNLDLKTHKDGFVIAGTVRARSTKLLNPSVESYLGGNFAASTSVNYGSDGVVKFSNLQLTAPDLRVRGGRGSWSPDGRISLVANGTSDRYGAIGVRVAGTIADPDAHVTADRPDLGIGLANLDARVTGAKGGYRLAMKGDTDYGPLKADVVLGTGKQMSLQINEADLSGVAFAGRLNQTSVGPFAGELTATGNGVNGVLTLSAERKYQAIDFNLRAQNAVFAGPANLSIRSAIIDGRAVLYDRPTVVADAQLSGTNFGGLRLATGRVLIDYRDGRGKAKGLVEGFSGVPFRVAFNGDLQPSVWRIAMDGKVRGQTFKTKSPARVLPKENGYQLLPTELAIGSGTARVAGSYGPGLKLQSRLENIDLAIINAFVPGYGIGGSASGSLDFVQPDAATFPRADARLTLRGLTRTSSSLVSEPVDVNLVGKLLPDGGEARAVFRRQGSVIGRMVASLRPLPPGAGSWTTRLLNAPLGGGIRYNGPADTLFSFAGQSGQTLSGPIGLAADFSCQLSAPCLSGVVKGKDLVYENQIYGTRLSKLNFAGRFDGSRLELDSLAAQAGSGTLKAQGYVSLAAADGYPMDISVTLDNARLARSNAISASATGSLRLSKKAGETALLSGDLRLPETRYQLIREGSAEVPHLAGVRFKPRRGPERITGDEDAEPLTSVFSKVRLDLHLKAPEKLYVSGMGLESEWKADFNLSGTSAAPVMSGNVELIRGTLGFAGRSFDLSNGLVSFNGGRTIDPSVAITAEDDVEDINVVIEVGGRAYDPEISFSSTPSLPDDEILSRILFGSSIANLSAIQAVQLASSLNSLRGSGGGLNPLGTLRSAAGIDRLRILGADETTGRGTALAAGQYITDDIYVELITDARGFTATQLEVSLTKWLSVLSQAGGSGVNSVNLRIKKNY